MKRIVNIVEDEKDLNELVKRYLEKEGYLINSYLTYDDAYAHLDDPCDMWLLDIMLDDKSGFDLIEEIKERNKEVPVIFMSARDKEFDRIIGLDRLKVIHVNDSKNVQGAKKDRHANLGEGHIGFDSLCNVVHHPKLEQVIKILETPWIGDEAPYKIEIEMLKNKNYDSSALDALRK